EAFIQDGSITNAKIGEYIQSSNWNGSTIGWHVNKNGDAWFNNANIRGQLTMDTTTNGIRTIVDYRGQRTYHANGQPAIICGYF
ncbi:phage tail tip fiber protein, partial [Yersinia enterocolitica]